MELGINPSFIQSFISKARICQVENDFMMELQTSTSDFIYEDAIATVNKLEPDQQAALVALMYVGRGDYDVTEWDDALEIAKNYWTKKTGEYLLSRPLVANYLEDGLEQLGFTLTESS